MLRSAFLARADLRGADLRGSVMIGVGLAGALCDWRWSVIPADLLRQSPWASDQGSRLIIDLAFYDDQRPWGWLKVLSSYGRPVDWVLGVLAESVRDAANAPEMLR